MEPEELTDAETRKHMTLILTKGSKKKVTKEDRLADEYKKWLLDEPYAGEQRKERFIALQDFFEQEKEDQTAATNVKAEGL